MLYGTVRNFTVYPVLNSGTCCNAFQGSNIHITSKWRLCIFVLRFLSGHLYGFFRSWLMARSRSQSKKAQHTNTDWWLLVGCWQSWRPACGSVSLAGAYSTVTKDKCHIIKIHKDHKGTLGHLCYPMLTRWTTAHQAISTKLIKISTVLAVLVYSKRMTKQKWMLLKLRRTAKVPCSFWEYNKLGQW